MLVVLMPSIVLLSPVSQRESLSPPPLVQLRIPSCAVRPALSSLAIDIFPGAIFLGGLSFRFRSGLLESVANPLIVFCPLFPCRYISGVRTLGVRVDLFVLVSSVPEVRFGRLVVLVIRTSGSAMKADASEMALADSGQFSSYMSLFSINLSGSSGSHSSPGWPLGEIVWWKQWPSLWGELRKMIANLSLPLNGRVLAECSPGMAECLLF